MEKFRILFLSILLTGFIPLKGFSQIYPATVSTSILGPCSIYLEDLYSALNPKLNVVLNLNDQFVPSRDVYLKLKLSGPGLTLQSIPNTKPTVPLTLSSGFALSLNGVDIADVFDFNKLHFSGISRQSLELNGRLPEGAYSICFTVMDYALNVPLSVETCVPLQLALSDPPQWINPTCGSVITQIEPANFLFNWILTNTNSQVDLSNVNYQINLYEVTSNTTQPQNAIQNNQALLVWQSPLLSSFVYNYGATDPILEVGKRYVYNVQAIENYEKTQIKNNGFSAPCWFYFGYPEGGTVELSKPDSSYQFNLSDIGLFKWKRPTNSIPGQLISYDYKLVKVNDGQNANEAIESNTAIHTYTTSPTTNALLNYTIPSAVLNDFEKMGWYAWKVVAKSGQQKTAASKTYTFRGPPYVDKFYAANFLIEVVSVTSFDTLTYKISGTGRTTLKGGTSEKPEFEFHDITLQSAGNNLWIMVAGKIEDDLIISPYPIEPTTYASNGNIHFQPDSIFIDKDQLKLGGICSWVVPLISSSQTVPMVKSKYVRLELANFSFLLAHDEPFELVNNYTIPLQEPFGFNLLMDYTTTMYVYQSKYTLSIDGFVELPAAVKDLVNSSVLVPFHDQGQLFMMEESDNPQKPEQIDFLSNADFGLKGIHYFIDFSDLSSPGDRASDSTWKGVYYQQSQLVIPKKGESSNQLMADDILEVNINNTSSDSNFIFIDNLGLNFQGSYPFSSGDTLKFNTFPSLSTVLHVDIVENEFNVGEVVGSIQIPVVSVTRMFPYTVPLTSFGFQIGNIDESLVDFDFVFNEDGKEEETVDMTITRAVFKGNERIEMDIDAEWPHFKTVLPNLQGFTAWGNGNIGFDIPNGPASLNSQSTAKSGDYNMVIDYAGAGRQGNAYAFGVSSKMNMGENIAGDNGAPIVNAYSMYINPLLSGTFQGNASDQNSILSGFNTGDSSVSSSTLAHANNLSDDMNSLGVTLGVGTGDTLDLGGQDNSNPIISEGTYAKLQRIVEVAELFLRYMDSTKTGKAQDYVTVSKIILNSDAVKRAVNKDPKEYLDEILTGALEGIIERVNQPITNATLAVTGRFRSFMDDKLVTPLNSRIDSVFVKVFAKIQTQLAGMINDPAVANAVDNILVDTRNSLKGQITNSVAASIENNITSKITDFIEQALAKQITDYIAAELRYIGTELINNGANANINLDHITNNAKELFESLGDTIASGVKSISFQNILKTGRSLVDDALSGIDWDQVLEDILNSALNNTVGAAAEALLTKAFGNVAGGSVLSNITSNVKFDFTDLGSKIKDGDVKDIVKFDPTNISIKTSACEVKGQLKHTKDDPIYGDHWRAMVEVKLLKPKKLEDVGISALFITGKTSYSAPVSANFIPPIDTTDAAAVAAYEAQLADDLADTTKFSYWFASLGISGLSVPLSPIPLSLTGIEGFAYHRMQKDSPFATPVPCRRNKLGLGVKFDFKDLPTSGKAVVLTMQLEVIINEGAWAMEMATLAKVGNTDKGFTMATATGVLGYYSAIKTFKGEITVAFNTAPVLCAGGTIKFNFDGINNTWYISAGTQEEPIFAKLLCKDWLSITTFVEAQNSGFKAGLDLNIDITAKSPWIDFGAVEVRGVAAFYVQLNTLVDLSFEPSFRLNEAYIYLAMGASISVDYRTAASSSSFTVAGVSIAGYAHYKAAPEGNLKGGMSGSVTVLGISCGLDINVDYDMGSNSDNS